MTTYCANVVFETFSFAFYVWKTYRNWFKILIKSFLKQNVGKLVFRRLDVRLEYESRLSIPIWLSVLLCNGWKLGSLDQKSAFLLYDRSVLFKLDLYKKEGWQTLWEIFVRESYGSDFKNKIVVDVGMNVGDSSIYFAYRGARMVIAIEPIKAVFERAVMNISYSGFDDIIKPINKALSCYEGHISLYYNPMDANVTTIDPMYNHIDGKNSMSLIVETITLKEIFSRFNLDKIDVLKIDCEGCEYQVISCLDEQLVRRIEQMIIEFHDFPKRILEILEGFDFRIKVSSQSKTGIIKAYKNK